MGNSLSVSFNSVQNDAIDLCKLFSSRQGSPLKFSNETCEWRPNVVVSETLMRMPNLKPLTVVVHQEVFNDLLITADMTDAVGIRYDPTEVV